MDQLLSQFGQEVQQVVDSPAVQFALRAAVLYLVLLWLGSAFWAFRDAGNRSRNLLAPYLAGALVVLATPLFFPLALVLYLIVRPGETLDEVWERRLTEEAAAETVSHCAACGRRTDREWLACPTCGAALHHRCVACGRLMDLDWNLCAWCGSEPARPVVELPARSPASQLASSAPKPSRGVAGLAAVGGVEEPVVTLRPSRVTPD